MRQVTIKDLKEGDYFILSDKNVTNEEVASSRVFVRQHYDRSSKTYSACKFDDICRESFFKPSRKVFVDFMF